MLYAIPPTTPSGGNGEPPWLTITLAVIGAAVTLGGSYLAIRRGTATPTEDAAKPRPTQVEGEADPELDLIRSMVADMQARLARSESKVEELTRELAREQAAATELRRLLELWGGRQRGV